MVMKTKRRKAAFVFPRCLGLRRALSRCRARPRHGRKEKERPASRPADWRDWEALPGRHRPARDPRAASRPPRDGAGAGVRVVRVEDPQLWRRIDLASDRDGDKGAPAGWRAMARAAVDRSAGRCESFRGRVDGDFLDYLAAKAPLLRSLHVRSMVDMRGCRLGATAVEKLPLLEQLVVAGGYFDQAMLCAVLDHCPRLRLLDAGGCYTLKATGKRLVARCESRIRDLRLPRWSTGAECYCCTQRAQEYADEYDE